MEIPAQRRHGDRPGSRPPRHDRLLVPAQQRQRACNVPIVAKSLDQFIVAFVLTGVPSSVIRSAIGCGQNASKDAHARPSRQSSVRCALRMWHQPTTFRRSLQIAAIQPPSRWDSRRLHRFPIRPTVPRHDLPVLTPGARVPRRRCRTRLRRGPRVAAGHLPSEPSGPRCRTSARSERCPVAVEPQSLVSEQRARQQVRLAQDLEAVANARAQVCLIRQTRAMAPSPGRTARSRRTGTHHHRKIRQAGRPHRVPTRSVSR